MEKIKTKRISCERNFKICWYKILYGKHKIKLLCIINGQCIEELKDTLELITYLKVIIRDDPITLMEEILEIAYGYKDKRYPIESI